MLLATGVLLVVPTVAVGATVIWYLRGHRALPSDAEGTHERRETPGSAVA